MAPKRTLLEKIGLLFPYHNFIRINEEQELTSNCSGISAIIAIAMVIVLLVMKLKQVFDKTTITATSQTMRNLEPPMINISTNMDDPKYFPYMLALRYIQNNNNNSTAIAVGQYRITSGSYFSANRSLAQTTIILETCTAQHFKVVPNIETLQYSWGISNWVCLPVNKTWEIGGDYELSTLYKNLQVNLSCTYAQNYVDCGFYKLYTLNSFINPTDPIKPSTYYINQDTVFLKAQSFYMFGSKLDQNILNIDQSIWPSVQLNTTTSTESNEIEQQRYMQQSPQDMTILRIEKSGKITTYNRKYLKIIDALAYIGGLFSSLLALFFFLGMFMRFYYEMNFAEYYYNSKDARSITFMSFIKQGLFGVLSSTPLKPNWPVEQKRIALRTTVTKALDIFYLHKRIAFLEKAISLLYDKHQNKGLQLCQHITKQQSDDTLKSFKLRDRLVMYLYRNLESSIPKKIQGEESSDKDRKQIKKITKGSEGFLRQSREEQSSEQHAFRALESEALDIQLSEQQLGQEQLVKQIQTDISKLLHEGQSSTGNRRTRKIYEMLDPWLIQSIKMAGKIPQKQKHTICMVEEMNDKND